MNIQPSSGEINAAELVSVMELKTPVVLPRTSLI
ncbi:copper-binding protein, partial [Escherichia coli]